MQLHLQLLLAFAVSLSSCRDETVPDINQAVFEQLINSSIYSPMEKPPSDGALNVTSAVQILNIGDISSRYLQFDVVLLISHFWTDSRLNVTISDESPDKGYDSEHCLDGESWHTERVWTPAVYLVDEQQARLSGLNDIKADNLYLRLCPGGRLTYRYRLQATLHCSMNLTKYPFDTQECKIELESWRYNNEIMRLEECTTDICGPTLMLTETVPEFRIQHLGSWVEPRNDPWRRNNIYSVLVVQLQFDREHMYYIYQFYMPSMLFVCVSWVSFWLDHAAAPARVTLGTSTLLSFVYLSSASKEALSKGSVITFIDWWYFVCMFFICASLLEYALVNIVYRRDWHVQVKKKNAKNILKSALKAPAKEHYSAKSLPSRPSCGCAPESFSDMNQLTVSSMMSLDSMTSNALGKFNDIEKFPGAEPKPLELEKDDFDDLDFNPRRVSVSMPTLGRVEKCFQCMSYPEVALWIDTRSRVVFPFAFLSFIIVYVLLVALIA
ncbi:unnamed protein product [Meganyctiphanes norvegica]|uniref:Uncharacterized protein n=1 Tax=Meganyctiphanes norvegica TaxID=48144 RepID=A0AAV2PR58_MEGNR